MPATYLNGANDSGKYDHLNMAAVLEHVNSGDVFEFLATELGPDVEYGLAKLTDVHRHKLLHHWRANAEIAETAEHAGYLL